MKQFFFLICLMVSISCNAQWRDNNIRLDKGANRSAIHVMLTETDSTSDEWGRGKFTPVGSSGLVTTVNYDTVEQVWALATWFGDTIYWKTYSIGAGTDDYFITDLDPDSVTIIDAKSFGTSVINGNWSLFTMELERDDLYTFFTTQTNEEIYLTVWYTKPE